MGNSSCEHLLAKYFFSSIEYLVIKNLKFVYSFLIASEYALWSRWPVFISNGRKVISIGERTVKFRSIERTKARVDVGYYIYFHLMDVRLARPSKLKWQVKILRETCIKRLNVGHVSLKVYTRYGSRIKARVFCNHRWKSSSSLLKCVLPPKNSFKVFSLNHHQGSSEATSLLCLALMLCFRI